jgi:hypothetical protein
MTLTDMEVRRLIQMLAEGLYEGIGQPESNFQLTKEEAQQTVVRLRLFVDMLDGEIGNP